MISPETLLYIYEIRGSDLQDLHEPPPSYIGLWNEDEFAYLFFTRPEDSFVQESLLRDGSNLVARHEMKYEDWQVGIPANGMTLAGIRFVVPGRGPSPDDAVILDPSVVFGDGNHPTTVGCLTFMREAVRSRKIGSMLDLGTGTGILALAGAKLGIEKIVAVDKNRLAISTALKNVRANSLSSTIAVHEGEARLFMNKPFDLVAANLPFQVLRELIPVQDVALHGCWIVSGVNEEQGAVLMDLFLDQGYRLQGQRADTPWVTFMITNTRYVH